MPNLRPLDFYILRIPTLAYNKVFDINRPARQSIAALGDALKDMFRDRKMQDAILLASPLLYFETINWINSDSAALPKKLILTLYKYVLRNGFRCTPYGLFSGCSYGSISASRSSILLENAKHHKMARLDMGYVMELVKLICKSSYLEQTKLFTNSSLYVIGNTYRYCDYNMALGKRNYFLSEIERTFYIDKVIDAARNGIGFDQLTTLICDKIITKEDSVLFINSLIDMQILEPGLTPKLTSSDVLGTIINQLKLEDFSDNIILDGLTGIDQCLKSEADDQVVFKYVKNILHSLLPGIDNKDLIQTDLVIGLTENNLNQAGISHITEEISKLSCLNQTSKNTSLEEFKTRMYQKYEEQEIPLLLALDTDIGLGYGEVSGDLTHYSPLLDDLSYQGKNEPEQTVWNSYQKWLLRIFVTSQKNNQHINVTPEDLAEIRKEKPEEPNIQSNFYAIGNIIADSTEKFDQGDYQFILNYCGGSSAFNLLSRFSKEGDNLFHAIKKYTELEVRQNQDKIIAEIVHFAGDRIGNILTRPKLFDYEISFLGSTSAEGDFRISATDLFVSVKNNRIVLRSKKLNKEIIPRLTSAHNYSHGLPFYRFLCDLQFQDANFSLKWDWSFLRKEPFLPRVTYNKIILSRSQWRVCQSEFTINNHKADQDRHLALTALLQQRNIPLQVMLAEGDNELYFDLSCIASQEILLNTLKKGDVVLIEYIQSGMLTNQGNSYANEVIIPIQNLSYSPVTSALINTDLIKRNYLPGQEWLYLKIYTSNRWMDYLLINDVNTLIQKLKHKNLISQWFFVRYKDTGTHLRIRLKKKAGVRNFESRVIKLISDSLNHFVEDQIIYKLQYDTYMPELEKYGPEAIVLSESVFNNDSDAILGILEEVNESDTLRWQVALNAMDSILNDFNFDLPQKLKFATAIHCNFINEFSTDKDLTKRLNDKFRASRSEITIALTNVKDLFSPNLKVILKNRSQAAKPIASQLIKISTQVPKLAGNYIHLFINRMFPANQRLMELTLYHFLKKSYESQLARNNN